MPIGLVGSQAKADWHDMVVEWLLSLMR